MENPQSANSPPRKWRRLQFSLRSLLIVITVFGVWLGLKVNRARRQRDAVTAIRALGGTVQYDYQHVTPNEPPGPGWLRENLGLDFLADADYVGIPNATSGKLGMIVPHLESLPALRSLHISHSQINDDDVRTLTKLTHLKELWLGGSTLLSGKSLSYIALLEDVRKLEVWHAQIYDDDLQHIAQLRKLEHLGSILRM
jgi:hypothetical protein